MYVKKGWYGLPVVLMLLFGCAHHMATKDEMPEENLKVKKTEKKEILKYGVKQWEVTLNPHPKVLEFREGFGEMRNKYQFYFDTIPGKIDRDEAVEIAKQLLKCEATNDFIYLPDDHKFYNKQPEYKHLSKVGHWYHKGMLVLSHSIDFFNGTYEGETVNNRLTIHFDKRLDADLSKIISLDSAVKIIKAQHDLSDSELCWDTPHNTNCFPQPELKIGLNMNNVKPLRYHIQYHFSYDLDKKVPSIYVVDAYTGHFTYRGGGRKSYVCSLSSCTKCVGSTITDDAGCTEYSPPTTPLPSSYSLVTSETGLMYPTYYDGCKSIVEIETGENAGINYRLFNAVHPHYTINTYTNCTLAGPSDPNLILNTCKTGPEFASPLINKSFTCQERSVLNALDAIHKTQNFVADHFVERNIYTNSANYFSNIKPVNTYIGIDEDGAYYAQDQNGDPYIFLGTGEPNPNLNSSSKNFSYANLEVVAHEYTHHLLKQHWNIAFLENRAHETDALHEALSDIFSIYFTKEIREVSGDFTIFEEIVNPNFTANNKLPRRLYDPSLSALSQAMVYNNLWDNSSPTAGLPPIAQDDIPYYKGGVISYWFYLLAKGLPSGNVNSVNINKNGLGMDKAEKILFSALETLKSKINNPMSPVAVRNGEISFSYFAETVLESIDSDFNEENAKDICSDEYSTAYRAFQAVGLIDGSRPIACNVADYAWSNTNNTCPPTRIFECTPTGSGDEHQFDMAFPDGLPTGTYYFQFFLYNSSTEDYEFENDFTIESTISDPFIRMEPIMLENSTIPIQLNIYNVTNVNTPENGPFLDNIAGLDLERYFFTCADNGCAIIPGVDGNDNEDYDPTNISGSVSLSTNSTAFTACPNFSICIDYTASGSVQPFVNLSDSKFHQIIMNITSTSQEGSFCWTSEESDAGVHSFDITVSDGNPIQPFSSNTNFTINVLNFNDVWANTSPVASKTNETSAGANNGSVTIGLGSTYTLEYRWVGLGPNGDDLVTYSHWPNGHTQTGLSDGTYTVDVYISGTDCLYGTYTATVGTNSSGGGTHGCAFDQNLIHMRAMPTVFNDQTTIEIELQEQPLQVNLSAQNVFGTASQSLVNGQVLGVGTHQVTFDGSADPNGLYIFQLALVVPQCQKPSA